MAKEDQTLKKITELLKKEFNPTKLYLFGSKSSGTAKSDSDYDLVMVLKNFRGDRLSTWEKCNDLIREGLGVRADVFAYSESDFEKSKTEFSSMAETAYTTGRELDLGAS